MKRLHCLAVAFVALCSLMLLCGFVLAPASHAATTVHPRTKAPFTIQVPCDYSDKDQVRVVTLDDDTGKYVTTCYGGTGTIFPENVVYGIYAGSYYVDVYESNPNHVSFTLRPYQSYTGPAIFVSELDLY